MYIYRVIGPYSKLSKTTRILLLFLMFLFSSMMLCCVTITNTLFLIGVGPFVND